MKVDVFEGARLIKLLLPMVWVLGVIVFVWTESPFVELTLETASPSKPFVAAKDCDIHDARQYLPDFRLEDEKYAHITLCFAAYRLENGWRVPYKQETDGRLLSSASFSEEVGAYTRGRAARFVLSAEDRRTSIEDWNSQRRYTILVGLGFAVGGWIVLSLATAVIGLILGDPAKR